VRALECDYGQGTPRLTRRNRGRGNPLDVQIAVELLAAVQRTGRDDASVVALSARGWPFSLGGDCKFDVRLLQVALRSRTDHVGVMGSGSTRERLEKLRPVRLKDDVPTRPRSPTCLGVGARTRHKAAGGIAARFVQTCSAWTACPRGETSRPIHASPADPRPT
jgi:xanthine/CO dehydrogenase XdhC/CoxF family maturation factor